MDMTAHSVSGRRAGVSIPAGRPLDYIQSGESFSPDPPYLFGDEDVYRLLDNKTIGPERVTLTTLTFVPALDARGEGRYDAAR